MFGELLAAVRPPAGVRVVFEPGRWLVADCGCYAAEVTDVKHAYGTCVRVLRGGINHFQLPTSWDIVHSFAVLPVDRLAVRRSPGPSFRRAGHRGGRAVHAGGHAGPRRHGRSRSGPATWSCSRTPASYGWEFAMPEFLGHPRAPRLGATSSLSGIHSELDD